MRAVFAIGVLLTVIAVRHVAASETVSKAQARAKVAETEKTDLAVRLLIPAFQGPYDVVKQDCKQKVPEYAKSDSFCECAASLTLELWRSGIDPKMRQRLLDYAKQPDAARREEFLQYEGPELYRPLCELAEPGKPEP